MFIHQSKANLAVNTNLPLHFENGIVWTYTHYISLNSIAIFFYFLLILIIKYQIENNERIQGIKSSAQREHSKMTKNSWRDCIVLVAVEYSIVFKMCRYRVNAV